MTPEEESDVRVFTREPEHNRRRSDRWADWASFLAGSVFALVGIVVLVSEVGYRMAFVLGAVDGSAETLWGWWKAFAGSAGCGALAAAFFSGSPKELGRKALESAVGKLGGGS